MLAQCLPALSAGLFLSQVASCRRGQKCANAYYTPLGCGHTECCVVLLRCAVAPPNWVCIGLYLHHPNWSWSGWGNTKVASTPVGCFVHSTTDQHDAGCCVAGSVFPAFTCIVCVGAAGNLPIVVVTRPCSAGTGVPVGYVGGATNPCTERPRVCGGDGKRESGPRPPPR